MSSTHVRCQECGREFPFYAGPPTSVAPTPPSAQSPSDDVVSLEVPRQNQHPFSAAVDFYYLSGLAVIGPLTGIELREAAFAEKVVADTLVTNNASGPWVAATCIKGLFDVNGIPLPHPPDALRQIERLRPSSEAVKALPLHDVPPMPPPPFNCAEPPTATSRSQITHSLVGRRPTQLPGIGLLLVAANGLLDIVLRFLSVETAVINASRASESMRQLYSLEATLGLFMMVVGLISSTFVIVGAVSMLRNKHYPLAMTASILAMIPCMSPCIWIGLPIGIWSIVVLVDKKTKDAFR